MSYLVFKDQKSFMNYFRQEATPDMAALYKALVDEEHGELGEAWAAHLQRPTAETTAEIADACLDIIYVATGLMHALGLDPQPLWDEVHRSNIDKIKHPCLACDSTGVAVPDDETEQSPSPCPDCRGQRYVYEVRRRADGKVLKPAAWNPPQLVALVHAMQRTP